VQSGWNCTTRFVPQREIKWDEAVAYTDFTLPVFVICASPTSFGDTSLF
jgi:hypothetical protein